MKAMKILVVITALVVVAGLTTDAWAQCSSARILQSNGQPLTNNIKFSDAGTFSDTDGPAGNARIGRFWDSDDRNNSNNGLVGPNFGSLCPPALWWITAGVNWQVKGALTEGACAQVGCPSANLTIVLEDYATAGPPGVGDTAFYMGMKVRETPVSARWYDYGLLDGATAVTILPMTQFPDVVITSSSRSPGAVNISYTNLDQSNNVHTWDAAAGAVYPTADVVREWQLVKATGTTDPGRLRAPAWTTINTTTYVPGNQPDSWTVPCTDIVQDEWVAIGIGFEGGTGVVDSALVGKAVALECNPNLAKPDNGTLEAKDPENIGTTPRRTGGRR